ncbi:hypothetical protein [Enterococcus faecalis]|uniref:hypothetical protein n=1 Tax=Enterococcus faecalis TaxID=1351 RepID=UPI0039A59876
MNLTIRELADELGVTKQAIRKRLDNLPNNLEVTKDNGVYTLNSDVVDFLRKNMKPIKQPNDNVDTLGNQLLIDKLIEENEFLKEQIRLKDQQIADWTNFSKSLRTESVLLEQNTKKKRWFSKK